MYECKFLWRRGLRVGPCLAWAQPLLRTSPLGEGERRRPSLGIRTWLLLLLRVSRCVPPSVSPYSPPLSAGLPALPASLHPHSGSPGARGHHRAAAGPPPRPRDPDGAGSARPGIGMLSQQKSPRWNVLLFKLGKRPRRSLKSPVTEITSQGDSFFVGFSHFTSFLSNRLCIQRFSSMQTVSSLEVIFGKAELL